MSRSGRSSGQLTQNKNAIALRGEHIVRESPFPPPDEMKVYEELCPGFTREFLDTYKKQVDHRTKLEEMTVSGDNRRADRAQKLSFAIVVIAIVFGCILLYLKIDIAGYVLLIGSLGSLITAFFSGSILRYIERKAKKSRLSQ